MKTIKKEAAGNCSFFVLRYFVLTVYKQIGVSVSVNHYS